MNKQKVLDFLEGARTEICLGGVGDAAFTRVRIRHSDMQASWRLDESHNAWKPDTSAAALLLSQ